MRSTPFRPNQVLGDVEILTGILPDKPRYHRCRCLLCGRELLLNANGVRAAEHGGCASCRRAAAIAAAEKTARDNFVGKRFGELLVLDVKLGASNGIQNKTMICRCLCDCGRTIETRLSRLVAGGALSCGHKTPGNLAKGHAAVADESVSGTRISSLSQKLSKNNTSGYKGVSMIRRGKYAGLYRAYIYFRRKQYDLGVYVRVEDAAAARAEAEARIYGDFLAWYAAISQKKED
jgi:hypothetical protein